jgi:hypothetical protein
MIHGRAVVLRSMANIIGIVSPLDALRVWPEKQPVFSGTFQLPENESFYVMAGLVPAIQSFLRDRP